MSDSLRPHGLQHTRLPCLSPTPGAYSNSCPSSQWCHAPILSSVIPFSSPLQSFPASGSFPMSQFFSSGGQSIGVSASASVLPMKLTFPLIDFFFRSCRLSALFHSPLLLLQEMSLFNIMITYAFYSHRSVFMLVMLWSCSVFRIIVSCLNSV